MAQWLRQDTPATIKVGPFVTATGARLTSLNIPANAVLLSKNGGALAAKSDTTAPTHDQAGIYTVALNSTDTNTGGRLVVTVAPQSNELPVWHEFLVLPDATYDGLTGSSLLPVLAKEFIGNAWDYLERKFDEQAEWRAMGAVSYNPLTAQVDMAVWLERDREMVISTGAAATLYTGAGSPVLEFTGLTQTAGIWFARAEPVTLGPGTYYLDVTLNNGPTVYYHRRLPLSVA